MWRSTTVSRLQQMAASMTDSSSDMIGGASSRSSESFVWSHEDEDLWTTTAASSRHDDDNASKMLPFCVNHPHEDYFLQLQQHHPEGCPVMIWKILRFIKLIVVRLAHSYAQRVILFALPLLLGLLVGFLWGRWFNNNTPTSTTSQQVQRKTSSSSLWSVLSVVNVLFGGLLLKFQQTERSAAEEGFQAAEAHTEQGDSVKIATHSTIMDNSIPEGSGLDKDSLPRHVAVIMDGNRRYGRARYQNATRGHRDGANQVLQVAKWCIAEEHIQVLTLYAFSTENWNRDPAEIAAIMKMFIEECENVRIQARQLNVRAHVVSSDPALIPPNVMQGLRRLEQDTAHCTGLRLNICVSYGSRSEIVQACRQVVHDVKMGDLSESQISEKTFGQRLLTSHVDVDPDILIRTSGETRISNYLLWQIAYAELFFVPQTWPELRQVDFIDILQSYAKERQRRFGR